MTETEVELIYNYLHENYEYRDGDLIRRKSIHGCKSDHVAGGLKIHPEGNGYFAGTIKVNGKSYTRRIASLIFLYHFKYFPTYIKYIDGNKANTQIENLKASRIRQSEKKSMHPVIEYKNIKYRPSLIIEGVRIELGIYLLEENAKLAVNLAHEVADSTALSPIQIRDFVREKMGKPMKINKSRNLPVGVRYAKNRFRADIRLGGAKHYLGAYNTPEEAHAVYLKAKAEHANK